MTAARRSGLAESCVREAGVCFDVVLESFFLLLTAIPWWLLPFVCSLDQSGKVKVNMLPVPSGFSSNQIFPP